MEVVRCVDRYFIYNHLIIVSLRKRAELCGLGMYQALDNRFPDSVQAKTGGLLQAMTYIAGRESLKLYLSSFTFEFIIYHFPFLSVSGGGGSVMILGSSDFATTESLSNAGNLNGSAPANAVFEEIAGKAKLGFNIR